MAVRGCQASQEIIRVQLQSKYIGKSTEMFLQLCKPAVERTEM